MTKLSSVHPSKSSFLVESFSLKSNESSENITMAHTKAPWQPWGEKTIKQTTCACFSARTNQAVCSENAATTARRRLGLKSEARLRPPNEIFLVRPWPAFPSQFTSWFKSTVQPRRTSVVEPRCLKLIKVLNEIELNPASDFNYVINCIFSQISGDKLRFNVQRFTSIPKSQLCQSAQWPQRSKCWTNRSWTFAIWNHQCRHFKLWPASHWQRQSFVFQKASPANELCDAFTHH